jgi:hypothetical protein
MRGRPHDSQEGAAMKLVEWPDNFPDLSDATPNLPALRRIGAAFAVMLVFSMVMVFVTMAHPPRPRMQKTTRPAACASCNCEGQCMRQRVR